jgi:hypothetical protein
MRPGGVLIERKPAKNWLKSATETEIQATRGAQPVAFDEFLTNVAIFWLRLSLLRCQTVAALIKI